MQRTLCWIGLVVVLGTSAGLLWRQHQRSSELDGQIVALVRQNTEVVQLQNDVRKLKAIEPSAGEVERLRADHAAIPRLRTEIDALKARITADPRDSATKRFETGSKVLAAEWRNAGNTTSRSTLETILWAAAGGDTAIFAQHLLIPEGRARQQALALLESLPPALRAQYGTPEGLVAFLAVKEVPLGNAEVIGWDMVTASPSTEQVQVRLSGTDGPSKDILLRFLPQGVGYKLLVPESAIARYARLLKAHLAAAAAAK